MVSASGALATVITRGAVGGDETDGAESGKPPANGAGAGGMAARAFSENFFKPFTASSRLSFLAHFQPKLEHASNIRRDQA